MSAVRGALAAVVVVVMGAAIAGIGMGSPPADRTPPPTGAALAASQERVMDGGARVRRGRALFEDEGCDRCHAIAAIGADGRLGPRLDRLDEDAEDVVESIEDPRDDTADGFAEELMPTDYAERMSPGEIRAVAALVAAASGLEAEEEREGEDDGGDSGRGRGRNRGDGGGE